MEIYHYDHQQIFIGTGTADESPLEPGVFLIPANATSVAVPTLTDQQQAVWNGTSWDVEDIPVPEVVPEEEPAAEETPAAPTTEELWYNFRCERNSRIEETDRFALADQTLTDEMRAYRQALRDLPSNTTDPENPVWPTKPS